MDTTRRRLAGQAATRTLAVGERALREAWESRGLNWRRAVLEAVVERWSCIPAFRAATSSTPPGSRSSGGSDGGTAARMSRTTRAMVAGSST
jgi:hypothetical protein